MRTTRTKNTNTDRPDTSKVIESMNHEELIKVSEMVARSALNTLIRTSGNERIITLSRSIKFDHSQLENRLTDETITDAFDLVHVAFVALYEYKELALDNVAYTKTLKNGKAKPVSVRVHALRSVNREVMKHSEYNPRKKTRYIEDLDTGKQMRIANTLHFDDFQTFKQIEDMIKALNLSNTQKRIVSYRLHGLSLIEIAGKLGVSDSAVRHQMQTIKVKLKEAFPEWHQITTM